MSADAYTLCPRCNATNEDQEPDSEFYGTVRVDHNIQWDEFKFVITFSCGECDWYTELTEKDIKFWEDDD